MDTIGNMHENLYFWPRINIEFGMEPLVVMHVLTMLISIPGNLLTIIIITNNKNLLDEPAYMLICSVSVADFFVSIFAQPMNVAYLLMDSSDYNKAFDLVFYFSIWGFCGASSFGVVFVTIDRYLYITHPMKYSTLLSRKRTYMMICTQWTCGLAYGAIPMINIHAYAFPTSIASLVTIILMTGCMAVVYYRVYRNIKQLKKQQKDTTGKRKQTNATVTIALIVLCFFICWFPYIILNFINTSMSYSKGSAVRAAYYWCVGLGCWNSAMNVLIYSFKNNTLKHEAKKFLHLNRMRIEPLHFTQYKNKKQKLNNQSSESISSKQEVADYRTFRIKQQHSETKGNVETEQTILVKNGNISAKTDGKHLPNGNISAKTDGNLPNATAMQCVSENCTNEKCCEHSVYNKVKALASSALETSLTTNIVNINQNVHKNSEEQKCFTESEKRNKRTKDKQLKNINQIFLTLREAENKKSQDRCKNDEQITSENEEWCLQSISSNNDNRMIASTHLTPNSVESIPFDDANLTNPELKTGCQEKQTSKINVGNNQVHVHDKLNIPVEPFYVNASISDMGRIRLAKENNTRAIHQYNGNSNFPGECHSTDHVTNSDRIASPIEIFDASLETSTILDSFKEIRAIKEHHNVYQTSIENKVVLKGLASALATCLQDQNSIYGSNKIKPELSEGCCKNNITKEINAQNLALKALLISGMIDTNTNQTTTYSKQHLTAISRNLYNDTNIDAKDLESTNIADTDGVSIGMRKECSMTIEDIKNESHDVICIDENETVVEQEVKMTVTDDSVRKSSPENIKCTIEKTGMPIEDNQSSTENDIHILASDTLAIGLATSTLENDSTPIEDIQSSNENDIRILASDTLAIGLATSTLENDSTPIEDIQSSTENDIRILASDTLEIGLATSTLENDSTPIEDIQSSTENDIRILASDALAIGLAISTLENDSTPIEDIQSSTENDIRILASDTLAIGLATSTLENDLTPIEDIQSSTENNIRILKSDAIDLAKSISGSETVRNERSLTESNLHDDPSDT